LEFRLKLKYICSLPRFIFPLKTIGHTMNSCWSCNFRH